MPLSRGLAVSERIEIGKRLTPREVDPPLGGGYAGKRG
jgi:hypothetical protein